MKTTTTMVVDESRDEEVQGSLAKLRSGVRGHGRDYETTGTGFESPLLPTRFVPFASLRGHSPKDLSHHTELKPLQYRDHIQLRWSNWVGIAGFRDVTIGMESSWVAESSAHARARTHSRERSCECCVITRVGISRRCISTIFSGSPTSVSGFMQWCHPNSVTTNFK